MPEGAAPDLTAEWFGSVLGGDVLGVAFEKIGIFSSELWRVRLDYGSGSGTEGPASVVLKRPVEGRGDRLGESFANEIRFYRELSHRLSARTPRFYAGDVDASTGRGFLLIEDIEVGKTNWMRGPSEAHARLGVAAMARMHAAFWGQLDDLGWIPSFADPDLVASLDADYRRNWSSRRDLFCDIVPGFGAVGDALLGRIVSSHARLADEPTLLHGDAHAENMPLVGEDVVLLDWAGPRLGSVGVDLGFFIPMSFPAERRPAVERFLVEHHTQVMLENDVAPSVDPWLAYRRGVLGRIAGLVGIVHTWDAGELASLKMIVHRCATAAVELRVEELVD